MAKIDPEGPWFVAAENALRFLFRLRYGRDQVEMDHWALIATAAYFDSAPNAILSPAGIEVAAHARQVLRSMLAEFKESGRDGCFTGDGRTCPTATRLEGLTAMYPLLEKIGGAAMVEPVRDAISAASIFLVESQILEGPSKGAFPRQSMAWLMSKGIAPKKMSDEVRIDYVQHAACGLKGALAVHSVK